MTKIMQVDKNLEQKIREMEINGPRTNPLEHLPLQEVTGKVETPAQVMMKGAKMVKVLDLTDTTAKENSQMLSLTVNSDAKREKALKSAVDAPTAQFAIDPSVANEISANIVYQISGLTANTQLFVKLSTQGMPKLSSVVQFDSAVVVETIVFTLDANNEPTIIADSVNMLSDFDIVSFLPNGGVYYVMYNVYACAGAGNAAIYFPSSASYSANEPNDSPFQAPLRHAECYFIDTFDNPYDMDVVRLQITNAEPAIMALTFGDTDYSGQVGIKIYHKTDANGNSVDRWLVNTVTNAPFFGIPWNNTSVKGEVYIYLQHMSGEIFNRPYTFSFTPVSKLQVPEWIDTGKSDGMTGIEYGTVPKGGGGYVHWVMGTCKIRTDFSQNSSHLTMTETGDYPLIPFKIRLVGQNSSGKWDLDNNTNYSRAVHNNTSGYATVGALLPGPWGIDEVLNGHLADYNLVEFIFLYYDIEKKVFQEIIFPTTKVYVAFSPFLNVDM